MCPPLSCCHDWPTRPGALRQRLYYLARLLLASGTEVLPVQQAALATRLDGLRAYLHGTMQYHYHVSPGRAQELTSQVVHALLRQECCRQSVRATISLAEALGMSELETNATGRPPACPLAPAQAEYPLARRLAHE